jgi:APA family basic amino acid/polyamine antiporter
MVTPDPRKRERRSPAGELPRAVGVPGATLLGLGSILGTGVFVSIGTAAEVAGSGIVLATALAAVVAVFNGLSSAQLAASHPVSGGTYEYGYRYLNPTLGFTAGWTFLCAKSASAATAALGLAGYATAAFGVENPSLRTALAAATVATVTLLVAGGVRRSSRANALIVTITIGALAVFIIAGARQASAASWSFPIDGSGSVASLLHATALMFVAYTGYGRIATLGEEIRDPARNIPRAIVVTLIVTMVLYVGVAVVALGLLGATGLASATETSVAPLQRAAGAISARGIRPLIDVAAVTAMAGVLLNLVLGLSRVLLAMGRRGDMPHAFAMIDGSRESPRNAVYATGAAIALLTLLGSVRVAWSFSAVTVLVYYALTNLAALRLPRESRRFPRWIAVCGLISCLGLAAWVDPAVWIAALLVIFMGLVWHRVASRRR